MGKGTSLDFDTAAADEFVKSFHGERNFRHRGGVWNMVLRPLRLKFLDTRDVDGTTPVIAPAVPVGQPLTDLFHNYEHYPNDGWITDYHGHKTRWPNAGLLRYGAFVEVNNGNTGGPTAPSGNPASLRYYFRVKGISDMVGGFSDDVFEISHDSDPVLSAYRGNEFTIRGGMLRPQLTQRYRFNRGADWNGNQQFQYFPEGGSAFFEINQGLVVNRLVGAGLHNPGTYFYDRIIACSGIWSGNYTMTIDAVRPFWLYNWFDDIRWQGAEGYVSGPDVNGNGPNMNQGNPPPAGFRHSTGGAGSNPFETLYYTHPNFNAPTMYPGARSGDGGTGMIPDEGWITSTGIPGEPSVRSGLSNSHVVEAMLLGIVAEESHRVETVMDLTAPRLLTEFPPP